MQARNLHWAISFDLHVLGMPPAFILSQDQTLNKNLILIFNKLYFPSYSKLTFCSVFKEHFLICIFFRSALIIYQSYLTLSTIFFIFFHFFKIAVFCLFNSVILYATTLKCFHFILSKIHSVMLVFCITCNV